MDIVHEYLQYLLIEKGLSQNTLIAYKNNILSFLSFYELHTSHVELKDISLHNCMQYCNFLGNNNASVATISQHISTLKSFFIFLLRKGYIENNPLFFLSLPKQQYHLPDILTVEEVNILLEQPDASKLGIRDKSILELLYATGIRVSELCNLELLDLDLDRGFIRVYGKGNKERYVPLYHDICNLLQSYLSNIRPLFCPIDKNVFLNRSGKKLTRQAIFLLLQKYTRKMGLHKTISPHIIRHSFASHMIENGADISTVQVLLGHADISTTEIYLQLRIEHILNMHQKYHPRG